MSELLMPVRRPRNNDQYLPDVVSSLLNPENAGLSSLVVYDTSVEDNSSSLDFLFRHTNVNGIEIETQVVSQATGHP